MKCTTEQKAIIRRNEAIRARNRAMAQIGPMVGKEYKPMPEIPVPTTKGDQR